MGVSARTVKSINSTKNSDVWDYMLVCDNIVSFEDFSVLPNGFNYFKIKLQSFLIHRNRSELNKAFDALKEYHVSSFAWFVLLFRALDK